MNVLRPILALLIAVALVAPAQAQQKRSGPGSRMYKCVDGGGKVYYSDRPSADCAQNSELNQQGVVVKKHQPPQPAQATAKPGDEAAKRKQADEQQRRDRALVSTYTTEQEIDVARERSMAIPTQAVTSAANKLEQANKQLFDLKKQADGIAIQKKAIPPGLLEDINQKHRDVSELEADLAQKKSQAESIRARFEADKVRFRELKVGAK